MTSIPLRPQLPSPDFQPGEAWIGSEDASAPPSIRGFRARIDAGGSGEITETRLYLEAMERILPRARMIVAEGRAGNAIRIAE